MRAIGRKARALTKTNSDSKSFCAGRFMFIYYIRARYCVLENAGKMRRAWPLCFQQWSLLKYKLKVTIDNNWYGK